MTTMRKTFLALSVLAGATSACASAVARTPPERPALEVPAPPTKVVEPPPRPEPMPDPVPDLPPAQPTNSRPSRPPVREAPRTEPKPEATTATTEAAPPPAPVTPAPQLRLPNTPDASEAAKQVQTLIERAGKSLDSVNTKGFTKGRRAVYDSARGLLLQAQEALKKSDFEQARKLAEKVELTAKELGGR